MVKIQKKIVKMFNISYVPANIQRLPENKYTTNSHLGITDQRFSYQEEIVKKMIPKGRDKKAIIKAFKEIAEEMDSIKENKTEIFEEISRFFALGNFNLRML